MGIKGFGGDNTFNNSKIASKKVISDTPGNAQQMVKWGNSSKVNIGMHSNTKAAVNPTSDTDDRGMGGMGRSPTYGTSNAGGASGDKSTGYGGGVGVNELGGAHGNKASRKINNG